ncbi:MAG: endopeptidase La [Gammaproteobacteria bacterium]|uniref:Lon protease n=1 Tax=SAR86 cluster bacterium TaxID=2030880 RepID=A0A520N020_9GAMM|nr:endopeptidase La [Gammaproteobacteria bacterium]MBA4729786.1 endopeptidase La [SAR86 cluster bacterium]RZO26824.1 MAG: endopeptidase La [SAR86 cluster bacterium]|tara:strand:+ start:3503 stop:5815 length:2313 start_codon:yes stop_codon:yes gene_type:complete
MSESINVKVKMPMIPLRDVVIFPNTVSTLFVGREKSIFSLEDALRTNKKIYLIAQNSPSNEEPTIDDLPKVGTISTLLQMIKLPDGTVKILVEGLQRATLDNVIIEKGYFANIVKIDEQSEDSKYERDLLATIKNQFTEFVSVSKKVSFEIINQVQSMASLSKVVDVISSNIHLSIKDKQEILEKLKITDRAEFLSSLLESQIDLIEVEQRIRGRVRKQMEKSQKEYFLNEQIKAAQKELGEIGEEKNELDELQIKIEETKLSKDALEKVNSEFSKLKQMSPMSAEATVVRTYIDTLLEVPWEKTTKINVDLGKAKKILDEDHYGLKEVKERILEYLAVQKRVKKMKAPVLCFVGPPGVGKTSLGESIARSVNREFIRLSLGGVRDEAEIRGHRKTYIGSMPGKIIQKLSKAQVKNPLFLLDEIDKVGMDHRGDPSSALLEVLDPEQNNSFNDHYLEVDYDLSEVMFICTANSLNIPAPLLDRMEIIRLPGYIEDEKLNIAKNYLVPRNLDKNGLSEKEVSFSMNSILKIIRNYTREAGVRSLDRQLNKICRKKVKDISMKKPSSTKIDNRAIRNILGSEPYKFGQFDEQNQKGQVNGLAWTSVGGELLKIEAALIAGKGRIIKTGSLGDVMQESIQAALTVAKNIANKEKIKKDFFEVHDLHIHVPEGATPKDGPSAGITMCTAIASVVLSKDIKANLAMTGEITLAGRVLKIGGLKEKLIAAKRSGITNVLIPKENLGDTEEIEANVLKNLNIIPVENIEEVLAEALI